MKTAHTPGPWLVRPNGWQITNADDGLVAVTHDETEQPGLLPHPESVANAHLIAASPALFDLLKEALAQSGCDGDLCAYEWHEKARRLLNEITEGNP